MTEWKRQRRESPEIVPEKFPEERDMSLQIEML
jgi:hypothetical protein